MYPARRIRKLVSSNIISFICSISENVESEVNMYGNKQEFLKKFLLKFDFRGILCMFLKFANW